MTKNNATALEIPQAANLHAYREKLVEERNNERKQDMLYYFNVEFNNNVLGGADSFRFIFPAEFLPFKEELRDMVKELGYTCKLIDDDFYGYVLHVQLA